MSDAQDGIAVIGMGARFPDAPDVATFWRNLRNGVESIRRFTAEEIADAGVDPGFIGQSDYVNAGAVLDDIELFDAGFFGYSPREAELLDPQQRLFLECAWEAIEHAGYDVTRYGGAIGVYGGVGLSRYLFNIYANPELVQLVGQFSILLANDKDHVTTRTAYKLDLKGPAVTVQTTCSTSLVAVCVACSALLDYSCDMALAGGASINLPQKTGYVYQRGGISSPDGHCRAFAADAAGTVAGNGAGVVLLKRLSDAVTDGDNVLAVIKGFAINNDGALKVGYTAPSVEGQAEVIAMAQAVAGVSPESVTYVEAHGTGTPLGDPIEVAALTQVFGTGNGQAHCGLGSVKSNIGHLDPAAGVAGLIKTVLALGAGEIPPTLNCPEASPKLGLSESPFYIATSLRPWPEDGGPRRAGVSSFGMGGTNAHVVVEEPPPAISDRPSRPEQIVLLSARSTEALDAATYRLADHLNDNPDTDLADVAFTTQLGRRAFRHRRAVVGRSPSHAAEALVSNDLRSVVTGSAPDGTAPEVAFLFPGQGAQHPAMAAGLLLTEPAFRAEVERCVELLRPHLDVDLLRVLTTDAPDVEAQLGQTAVTQPALFVVEYALARLLMSWGVQPSCMLGHSIGEYVAATLAGVFGLGEALGLVATRGRLMQQLPPGAMVAISMSENEVVGLLDGELALAAVNGPSQCVVSGPLHAIERLENDLGHDGAAPRRLRTSHAFHHQAMAEPILEAFQAAVEAARPASPTLPFLSNLTGTWIADDQARDPAYWVEHLCHTVRFGDGLAALTDRHRVLVEVGPGQTLSALAGSANSGASAIPMMRHPRDRSADDLAVARALCRLWVNGVAVDWQARWGDERRLRTPLPTYPFERQRYWIDPPAKALAAAGSKPDGSADPHEWLYVPSWTETDPPPTSADREFGLCLAFVAGGVGQELVHRLRERGTNVVAVEMGSAFEACGSGAYRIDPGRRQDYATLLAEIGPPARVLHLWTIGGDDRTSGPARFPGAQRAGFYSLLFLAQCMAERFVGAPFELDVITASAVAVTGDETLRPEVATVLGPCRVVPQEYPNVVARWIDVDDQIDASSLEAEAIRADPGEPTVAWRGRRRFTLGFERAPRGGGGPATPRLREGGVYVVTGGLGQLGSVLADHLVRHMHARLVVTGRTPPAEVESRLGRFDSDDGQVIYVEADVTDREAMRGAFATAVDRFGALDGVFHLAGRTGRVAAQATTSIDETASEAHFAPKAHGVYVIDELAQEYAVDLCVLFSSLSTVLGGLGFVAYSAANAFMDAFAHTRPGWLAIDWDGWGDGGIPFELGMAALEPAMSLAPRAIVSASDLERRIDQWVAPRAEAALSPPSRHPRPQLTTTHVDPASPDERVIAGLFETLLGVDGVGVDDDFFELGGHSLLAIQLVSRLRDAFRVELAVEVIFDAPTVAQLADVVAAATRAVAVEAAAVDEALDFVERLTPGELEALLEDEDADPVAQVRRFYDSVSASLDASEFGRHAHFLNYGFVGDRHEYETTVELPENMLDRASTALVLEVAGDRALEGAALLDVGCGRGGTLRVLDRHYQLGRSVGVDLSRRSLAFCAATGCGDDMCQADAQRLPFADGAFGVVTNIESSHSYPDLPAFYREVHRLLMPGGWFLYADNLPITVLERAEAALLTTGFTIEHRRDITSNVLRSCDEAAARRRHAFVAAVQSETLDSFLAVPGTTVYDDMESARSRYVILRLRRP